MRLRRIKFREEADVGSWAQNVNCCDAAPCPECGVDQSNQQTAKVIRLTPSRTLVSMRRELPKDHGRRRLDPAPFPDADQFMSDKEALAVFKKALALVKTKGVASQNRDGVAMRIPVFRPLGLEEIEGLICYWSHCRPVAVLWHCARPGH